MPSVTRREFTAAIYAASAHQGLEPEQERALQGVAKTATSFVAGRFRLEDGTCCPATQARLRRFKGGFGYSVSRFAWSFDAAMVALWVPMGTRVSVID